MLYGISFIQITAVFSLLCMSHMHTISQEQKNSIKKSVDAIIHAIDPHATIGVHVTTANNHDYYTKNMHQLCTPASTLKLFTSAAALHILGAEYRFATQLYIDGVIKHGILRGDVYLQASGDPALTTEDLAQLVQQLKKIGIKKIIGDIMFDVSAFDEVVLGPGWSWDDRPEDWNAPLTALNVNRNCIEVSIDPRAPKVVTLNPHTAYVAIDNQAQIVPIKKRTDKPFTITRIWQNKKNVIKLTGTLSKNGAPRNYTLALKHPIAYGATLFKELLAQENILLKGSIKKGLVPDSARLLATHYSAPLKELIKPILKNSDNLYTDCLFKTIGAHLYGFPGTWEKGNKAMMQFMQDINTFTASETDRMHIFDGCGKSRYNLISPAQITSLLIWIKTQPWYQDFFDALPCATQDGTLKNRLKKPVTKERVYAKTGNLKGVSALAGYLYTKNNQELIFAINTCNFTGPAKKYKALEDTLCAYFADLPHYPPQRSTRRK